MYHVLLPCAWISWRTSRKMVSICLFHQHFQEPCLLHFKLNFNLEKIREEVVNPSVSPLQGRDQVGAPKTYPGTVTP